MLVSPAFQRGVGLAQTTIHPESRWDGAPSTQETIASLASFPSLRNARWLLHRITFHCGTLYKVRAEEDGEQWSSFEGKRVSPGNLFKEQSGPPTCPPPGVHSLFVRFCPCKALIPFDLRIY
jgi:hypothetical protein